MKKIGWFRLIVLALLAAVLAVGPMTGVAPAGAAEPDWDIPGGHYFTQTGKDGTIGYTVTDDGGVLFWSEFKRLGGVNGVGYPVSGRFEWNGFTCQAMQKVVFQWQPQSRSVAFVNVFDLMHDSGKDAWLLSARQTPEPKQWQEDGLAWDQVVKGRLAVMDNFPEIKKAYLGVPGDPIQLNGLPTTDVVDMGNNYTLRAQRVVIQQWKEDVPWAKKGQVTFGLGGQISKESGVLPAAPSALVPHEVQTFADGTWRLLLPTNYMHLGEGENVILVASPVPGRRAFVNFSAYDTDVFSADDLEAAVRTAEFANYMNTKVGNFHLEGVSRTTVAGLPAVRVVFTGDDEGVSLRFANTMVIHEGKTMEVWLAAEPEVFSTHEPNFDWILSTIVRLK